MITPKGQAPVAELEIELFSGDQDDMIALGRELAAKYNLTPGNKSKFQVGLELINGIKTSLRHTEGFLFGSLYFMRCLRYNIL